MSRAALETLRQQFETLIELNQSALDRLDRGVDLASLDELFAAKAKTLEALKMAAAGLSNASDQADPAMGLALQAQARCARLEAQLAERLGALQKPINVSTVTKAYGKESVDKLGINGLNLES